MSTTPPRPPYRKPTGGPTPSSIDDRERWRTLTETSLSSVQAAAEKWRTGLAAFVTLVTGGLLIKGPESAQDLTNGWRFTLSLLAGLGLFAAILGLWLALRAAAGSPAKLHLPSVVQKYGSVRHFEVANAAKAADSLRWAKVLVGCALLLLGTAVIAWWWAPKAPPDPPAQIKIETSNGTACGVLKSADGGALRIQVAGESTPRSISFTDVNNLRVVASCSADVDP